MVSIVSAWFGDSVSPRAHRYKTGTRHDVRRRRTSHSVACARVPDLLSETLTHTPQPRAATSISVVHAGPLESSIELAVALVVNLEFLLVVLDA